MVAQQTRGALGDTAREPGAHAGHHLSRQRRGESRRGHDLHDTPTFCQARTRLYRHGRLAEQGFAVAQISDFLAEEGTTVWLDLRDPDHADLAVLQEEFGLHPLEVEDALWSENGRRSTVTPPTCS